MLDSHRLFLMFSRQRLILFATKNKQEQIYIVYTHFFISYFITLSVFYMTGHMNWELTIWNIDGKYNLTNFTHLCVSLTLD